MPSSDIKVFYSYSHKDERLRDRLESHLSLLKREGIISQWHDRKIGSGVEWQHAIHDQLSSAHIILLLISADFLASDYCYDIEMTRAMELHETGDTRVIPIILRPCEWNRAPFAKVNVLPTDGRPVIHWRDQDTAFTEIARGIREAVSALRIRRLESEVEKYKRVIVADDEQVISRTLSIILNQAGFEAQPVFSGEQCLEESEVLKPGLVISDVIMTGMTGIQAAIELGKRYPECRVILFSGQPATADLLERARSQGYEFEILAKPVHPVDLLNKLSRSAPSKLVESIADSLEDLRLRSLGEEPPFLSEKVTSGMIMEKTRPLFPAAARGVKINLQVLLAATVSETGTITKLRVSTGSPLLHKNALEAVRQWRFQPHRVDGNPVEYRTLVTLIFDPDQSA